MAAHRFSKHTASILGVALQMVEAVSADALLILLDGSTDWKRLRTEVGEDLKLPILVAADTEEDLEGASEFQLIPLVLNKSKAPLLERLQHALLEAASDEVIRTNGDVIAIYSGFQQGRLDSISHLQLDERMRRLTVRDLQKLESRVPLQTIKAVVDVAVEIGREGREGKPVGTLFVVGDTRRVLEHCNDGGADPYHGYKKDERNLLDRRVREDVKEVAQLDGAFIISQSGTIEKSRQMLEVIHNDLSMDTGLGSRHWAGAAISAETKSIAVVVSQSTGTVRIYQGGQLVIRIEPMDKAVTWQEFNYEPPPADSESKSK